MSKYCSSLVRYLRRESVVVSVGGVCLGGGHSIKVQSMTNTDTNDTAMSVAQIMRIAKAGGEIVRLTAQGKREAANLENVKRELVTVGYRVPLVADIHFLPEAALVAAHYVDKVRINPGNFNDKGGQFSQLLDICRNRGVALRIGVNHGSLSSVMVERYGDTPRGMVESAMEFLRLCRVAHFDQVVVSMKSSNVRVMVHAYRMLAEAMEAENMNFPLHLGVTEAGNDMEGRVKSAVGIGALLADGIGDTIRVSLTEAPENEIPVARMLADYFTLREQHAPIEEVNAESYSPYEYRRVQSGEVCGVGGGYRVVIGSEITDDMSLCIVELDAQSMEDIPDGAIVVLTSKNINAPAAMRAFFLRMAEKGLTNPVIIKRCYDIADFSELQVKAAADTGMLFLDGFGDGLWIEDNAIAPDKLDELSLAILQASRVRVSKPEYIACPGCGRTLYDLESTLKAIKERTKDMVGVKIGVMGCIVNGPGEMADADFGYVGAGAGRITLYRGKEVVKRNIPQENAIEELICLINESK